jgi:starch phosphorylase
MEFALDQSLKTYSGGLGFLAGSHMRSAYELKQNMVGIGILWSYGYYDQVRHDDNTMHVQFRRKSYNFLEDTGIKFQIAIHNALVWVKAFYLSPDRFGTVPMFFLSTDIEENDPLARTTCHRLYDSNPATKIAQGMVLGMGGYKLLKELGYEPGTYHMNEAHALPIAFAMYKDLGSVELLREKLVFTTHTPEEAGNEKHLIQFLEQMTFFGGLSIDVVRNICGVHEDVFNHTLVALRMSRLSNAVSELHGEVARKMWSGYDRVSPIIHITNSQNKNYWMDEQLGLHFLSGDKQALLDRKKELKKQLFEEVADQTGKWFDPNVLTIVWARRFAYYKRPDLITRNIDDFERLLQNQERPVQIIWAGKPYPLDQQALSLFNKLVKLSRSYPNVAVLTGYELKLSRLTKYGADIWLNTPIVTREASGTSGMTGGMNGAINLSTDDGWICEFARHGINAFVMPKAPANLNEESRDEFDRRSFYALMGSDILPLYYQNQSRWNEMMYQSMKDILSYFESGRMAEEYYRKMY